MMYNQKFAAAIKANGKVLREFKDQVFVPFASEYSILLKNLNTKRAIVNVYIDGDNAVPGGLVIDPGREIDLERWIKNGNLTEGNKFKFIERTGAVEQHRGVKLEDGIVRIEFEFEREQPRPIQWIKDTYPTYTPSPWNSTYGGVQGSAMPTSFNVNGVLRGADMSKGETIRSQASASIDQYCADNNIKVNSVHHDGMATMDCAFNDVGITVPGSKSDQSFRTVSGVYGDGTKHSIVLNLLGETPDNRPVVKPVTVRTKPKCTTCGRQNKHTAKFCTECGTSLEIFA